MRPKRAKTLSRTSASLVLGVLWLVQPQDVAQAATVRDVAAFPSSSETRIVVAIDGPFRFRSGTSEDGRSVQVDIEDATVGEDAPRVVPVADDRVDGVLLLDDLASGTVRVSIDLSGGRAAQFEADSAGGRLVVRIGDFVRSRTSASRSRQPASPSPSEAARADERDRADLRAVVTPPSGRADARGKQEAVRLDSRPAQRPAQRAARPAPKPLVVLDPGHGGKDPGARAWTGEWEKDIVLDLARRVARRLRDRGDVEVVMTRSDDSYVELADRRDASRRWSADAFVSIHANASASSSARGIETYYHSRKGGTEARRLARLENAGRSRKTRSGATVAPMSTSKSPPPVLDRRAESIRLARLVQGELVSRLGMRYEAVRDLGAKEGPFFVIGNNAAPSVLVEAAFLTHREEGVRMGSEVFREQIADGVARGIVAFLEQQRRAGAL